MIAGWGGELGREMEVLGEGERWRGREKRDREGKKKISVSSENLEFIAH